MARSYLHDASIIGGNVAAGGGSIHDITGSSNTVGAGNATKFSTTGHYVDFRCKPLGLTSLQSAFDPNFSNYPASGRNWAYNTLVCSVLPHFEFTGGQSAIGNRALIFRMKWKHQAASSFEFFNINSVQDSSGGVDGYGRVRLGYFDAANPGLDSGWGFNSVGGPGDNQTNPAFRNFRPEAMNPTSGPEYQGQLFTNVRGIFGTLFLGPLGPNGDPLADFNYLHAGTPSSDFTATNPGGGAGMGLMLTRVDNFHIRLQVTGLQAGGADVYIRNLKLKVYATYLPLVHHGIGVQAPGDGAIRVGVPRRIDNHSNPNTLSGHGSPRGSIMSNLGNNLVTGAMVNVATNDPLNAGLGDIIVGPFGESSHYGSLQQTTQQIKLKDLELESLSTTSSPSSNPGSGPPGTITNTGNLNQSADSTSEVKLSDFEGYETTVLCTEMYRQGKLSRSAYVRDKEMTNTWMAKRPFLKAGYLCFAHWPLWMLRNKKEFAEKYMHHVIRDFSYFYADKSPYTKKKYKKNNWVGKSMMIFGQIVFPPLGLLAKLSRNKTYRLILSTLTTIFWFIPLFIYSLLIICINKLKGD